MSYIEMSAPVVKAACEHILDGIKTVRDTNRTEVIAEYQYGNKWFKKYKRTDQEALDAAHRNFSTKAMSSEFYADALRLRTEQLKALATLAGDGKIMVDDQAAYDISFFMSTQMS